MLRQTRKNSVSSCLGNHILLDLFKNKNPQTKKYVQIEKALKERSQYKTESKVFYSDTKDLENSLVCVKDAIKIDFNDKNSIENIKFGIGGNIKLKEFCDQFLKPETTLLLTNTSSYENKWKGNKNFKGALMKVYNSFSYTEDVKYEARLLELPMLDDFKLIIIPPNEVDVLCNLFNKLIINGLTAAIGSIQPLFTSVSELQAPSIKFFSATNTRLHNTHNNSYLITAEFGNVQIDENGVSIKVVTYMIPSNTQPQECPKMDCEHLKKTFFFGLIFKDIPIFTGQYVYN